MTIHAKTLRIRFDKVDGIIKIYDGTRYLVLFVPEKYGAIHVRFSYHISEKVLLHIVLIIILQESDLIHIIFTYRKRIDFL